MAMPQTDIKTQVEELSADAIEAFCGDIAGMFGVDMESAASAGLTETINGLEKKFKPPAVVITINARGTLNGNFHLVFNKEGLFTLAGTIVMLPEERIQANRKKGTAEEAEKLHDAVGEAGNLLVGSWDRIFREGLKGHEHFLQAGTFIGNPWKDPINSLGLSDNEAFLFYPCEMTIGSFPAFSCGVIFPNAIFNDTSAEDSAPAPEEEAAVKSAELPETEESTVAEEPEPEETDAEDADTSTALPNESKGVDAETPAEISIEPESQDPAGGAVSQTIKRMVRSLPVDSLLNVCAKEVMSKDVLWADPEDSVLQAMQRMQQFNAACILVGSADSLEGIVTWIDIAEAVSIYLRPVFAKWRRPVDDATLQIKMRIIMTRPVRTISPQTSLTAIMEDICRHRLRCLPVMNEQGNVEGVITTFDIFQFLLKMTPNRSAADCALQ